VEGGAPAAEVRSRLKRGPGRGARTASKPVRAGRTTTLRGLISSTRRGPLSPRGEVWSRSRPKWPFRVHTSRRRPVGPRSVDRIWPRPPRDPAAAMQIVAAGRLGRLSGRPASASDGKEKGGTGAARCALAGTEPGRPVRTLSLGARTGRVARAGERQASVRWTARTTSLPGRGSPHFAGSFSPRGEVWSGSRPKWPFAVHTSRRRSLEPRRVDRIWPRRPRGRAAGCK
jgi:hypothetical protein